MQSSQITMRSAARARPKCTPLSLTAAVAVASAFTLFSFSTTAAAQPLRRPNIVLILADDLGFGDLGCYGHPRFKTPRIDRLAAEGVRLTQCNTPCPYCAPTRAALLTGRYPSRCDMLHNPAPDAGPKADVIALPRNEATLAEVLRASGYATGMVGKWHLGHKPGALPTERGFDEYFGILYSNDMRPVQVWDGTKVVEDPARQATLTERYTRRAVDFIERKKTEPFFLYLAHAMPHKPLAASEKFYRKSGAGLYGDAMAELDASVGAVVDALQAAGLDDDTLIIFTSDNGPWFGGSTGGLRGMKASTYEGGSRVPCIARRPGVIPAGKVSSQLTATMDLFATIVAATGAKIPLDASGRDRTIDGVNLLPLFTGSAQPAREFVFGCHGGKISTVRDARWKLHALPPTEPKMKLEADGRWLDPRGPDGTTIDAPPEQYGPDARPGPTTGVAPAALQLFDLTADPSEQRDVAAQHPEEVKRLRQALEAFTLETLGKRS